MTKTFWEAADTAVEYIDGWADRIPGLYRHEGRWHILRYGQYGCRVQLWGRFSNWLEATGRIDRG